jgi:hypothetical protein
MINGKFQDSAAENERIHVLMACILSLKVIQVAQISKRRIPNPKQSRTNSLRPRQKLPPRSPVRLLQGFRNQEMEE